MKTTLIITTYKQPDKLILVLQSAFQQTRTPGEIIVADDGSGPEIAGIIKDVSKRATIPIKHCWQPDKGFRAARIRNKALAAAIGDYIVLIDSDIIMHPCFIEDHIKFASPGYFLQGGRVLLGKTHSGEVLAGKKSGSCFTRCDVGNRKNCLRINWLARVVSHTSSTVSGTKTCNFSFRRDDAIAVNGFNEEFTGWGDEDSEFAARLLNAGLKRRIIRFNAIAYHLYHPLSDRDRLQKNNELLQVTIKNNLTRCQKGLDQHLV